MTDAEQSAVQAVTCACLHTEQGGFHFDLEVNPNLVKCLVTAYKFKSRVRLFYGDTQTGKPWIEEHDLTGRIGRSTGRCNIPLLIHNSRSTGGSAILVNCIVAMQIRPGYFLYRHPGFEVPNILIKCASEDDWSEYRAQAIINGEVHARFKTFKSARRWARFMTGKRMTK